MIGRLSPARLLWGAATAAVGLVAVWIAVDTLRSVVPLFSPLPWFDEWATVELLRAWQAGERSAWDVLFSQHNEHRILLPRLVFFADDALFRGQGWLSLAGIFLAQLLHAAMFAAVLWHAGPQRPGRWAVAGLVLALMFSLRQAENFSSAFQLQFVAVFAGATLTFLLFGLAVARAQRGQSPAAPLGLSFAAGLGTSFTMANGLVAPVILVVLALLARLRPRVVLLCAASAALLAAVYLQGYEPVAHHSRPAESLTHPVDLLLYVATYLGSILGSASIGPAAALGALGIAATVAATARVAAQRPARPASLALLGIMLFVGAGAAITASGRLGFGTEQALSSRYVTGSATFWAAQLTYWCVDPPRGMAGAAPRAAAAAVSVLLLAAVWREQGAGKPQLAAQSFAQNESQDLLLLGFDDPEVLRRAAWGVEDVQRLLPVLRENGISIFATRAAAALGRPVVEMGRLADPCAGAVTAARPDASLGPGGVRVAGTGSDGPARRLVRRVVLADGRGIVVGLGSGAIPGADRGAWRGFAAAPPGSTLTAYGLIGAGLCRIGSATVAQTSQPEETP